MPLQISLGLLKVGLLLSVARCDFLDSLGSRQGRSLFSGGQAAPIDGTNPARDIVAAPVNAEKAVLRYQDSAGGSSIKFQVATRDPSTNNLMMHTPVTVSRAGSDETQTPNAALAGIGQGKLVSCELTRRPVNIYMITCSFLTVDDASDSISVGSWNTLVEEGWYPGPYPDSISVVGFENGKAIACYRLYNRDGSTSPGITGDSISCRVIMESSNAITFGSAVVVSSESADDISLARFDTDSAFICYSDRTEVSSNDNSMDRCQVLTISGSNVQVGNSVNLGARSGSHNADPCVVSRLNTNQGIACCEKPSWIPGMSGWRNYLECRVLFTDNSDQLSLSGGHSFPDNTFEVSAHFGRMHVEAMVHVRDANSESFGEAVVCYNRENANTRLTCDTLQVKESWSWLSWRHVRYLEIKHSARYELYAVAERGSSSGIDFGKKTFPRKDAGEQPC